MHHEMIKVATEEQLRNFVSRFITKLKEIDYEIYEMAEEELHVEIYGKHFNEKLLNKALTSPYYSLEKTNSLMANRSEKFNSYDFNYVMNILHKNYHDILSNDTSTYCDMALKLLKDNENIAYCYYKIMSKD